ncbi:MAG: alpha-galactosidase [Kiritimatiellae bacterium]|nr:alpha-galactosidase [Kiritimatiellia bacterium]
MNTRLKVALTALGASAALFAGTVGDDFLLNTRNTTLALRKEGGRWHVLHYGSRVDSQQDINALAWNLWTGGHGHGQRRPASYAVYGEKTLTIGINKYGGLQVTHADGCPTTSLEGMKAETLDDASGATHLVLTMKDRVYPFHVTQHFRALADCDVIETWVELRNGEDGAVRLGRMDSFAMDFPAMSDTLWLQNAGGQWAAEAQLQENAIGRGQTLSFGSRSGVRDAFENNASFMLTAGCRSTETSGQVLGGVLCWSGSWGIGVQRDFCDFVSVRAGVDTSAGAYVLDPGKTIVLPKFAFTWSSAGKGQISRNIHRWARRWQMPAGSKLRPVLLNSWEGSYFSFTEKVLHDMMDGVKEMGGELFVLDDGWFGTGKYARDDVHRDKVGLGDWVINPEKLPNGLVGLNEEARRRGLKFGFWVEPEMVNTNSWLYEAHPDWIVRERRRPVNVGRGGSQTVLDYTNPAVRENIFAQLDALYSKIPGLSYIKWDANADFFNMGSPYLDEAHQANMPFDYTVGLYDLLARIRAKYPDIDIQACSSGGGHADYGFLRYADEFWGSDDSDARERIFIQWGESQFYPACAIAAHVTAVPNHQTGRTTPLKFRFDVAMSARLGFELHPKELSADDLAFAKQCVSDYKRIRPVVQQGDLYRLVSPYGHSYASLMYVDESRDHAVVFLWGMVRGNWSDYPGPLALQGLDASKRYRVREINRRKGGNLHCRVDGKTLGGQALLSMGLPVRLRGDWDSAVFELTAE